VVGTTSRFGVKTVLWTILLLVRFKIAPISPPEKTRSWSRALHSNLVDRGGYDPQDDRGTAVHHARVVMAVVDEAVSEGEMADVRDQLPAEYDELFVAADREEQAVTEKQQAENTD
jgi:hypothetical protein